MQWWFKWWALRAYRRITNTNLIVFGLTRLGIAHTIYRTRGEQANHYIPHTVKKVNVVNINMYLFNLCLTYNICIGMCSIALCILTVWKRKEYHELLRSYVNRNIHLIKKNYEKPRNHSQTIHRKLHITQHEVNIHNAILHIPIHIL
jgi:hypothetical protein